MSLESDKQLADFFWPAKLSHRIGNRVAIFHQISTDHDVLFFNGAIGFFGVRSQQAVSQRRWSVGITGSKNGAG
jgi:hypothetical protein